ncbi:MAG: hypothetical protein GWP91_06950 [Rhodobacterales bacterium]|nr:hypothetical protein [Rhodobacterales bacterium]
MDLRISSVAATVFLLTACGGLSDYSKVYDTGLNAGPNTNTNTGTGSGNGTGTGTGTTGTGTTGTTGTGTSTGTGTATGTTSSCNPPNLFDLTPTGPAGGNTTPVWVGIGFDGIADGGDIVDMQLNGTDSSAWLTYHFYDDVFALICSAIFDASTSLTPSAGAWNTASGGIVHEGWSINLTTNSGFTDYPTFAGVGHTDARGWAAARSWRIGIGEMVDIETSLRPVVESTNPGDWNTLFAGKAFSLYLDLGTANDQEVGYAFQYTHSCYDVNASSTVTNAPTGAAGYNGYVTAYDWNILRMTEL